MAEKHPWDDHPFPELLNPAQRAAYDAETRRLAEQWEREEEEDWMGEPDEFLDSPEPLPDTATDEG